MYRKSDGCPISLLTRSFLVKLLTGTFLVMFYHYELTCQQNFLVKPLTWNYIVKHSPLKFLFFNREAITYLVNKEIPC